MLISINMDLSWALTYLMSISLTLLVCSIALSFLLCATSFLHSRFL